MVFLKVAVRGQKRHHLTPENVHLCIFGARSVHVYTSTPHPCIVNAPWALLCIWSHGTLSGADLHPGPIPKLSLILEGSIAELLLSPSTFCMLVFHRRAPAHVPRSQASAHTRCMPCLRFTSNTYLYFRLRERAGNNVSFQDTCVSLARISFYVLHERSIVLDELPPRLIVGGRYEGPSSIGGVVSVVHLNHGDAFNKTTPIGDIDNRGFDIPILTNCGRPFSSWSIMSDPCARVPSRINTTLLVPYHHHVCPQFQFNRYPNLCHSVLSIPC